jgi:hypothetical protein
MNILINCTTNYMINQGAVKVAEAIGWWIENIGVNPVHEFVGAYQI